MNTGAPPDDPKFDVALEPAPRHEVVDAEEDEDSKRKREAELASTFDQSLAHHGKTEEEMIEERQAEARLLVDVAIAAGIIVAVAENQEGEIVDAEEAVPPEEEDGGD
jgi:hypothetical protein